MVKISEMDFKQIYESENRIWPEEPQKILKSIIDKYKLEKKSIIFEVEYDYRGYLFQDNRKEFAKKHLKLSDNFIRNYLQIF